MPAFDREQLKIAIRPSIIRVFEAQNSELDLHRNTIDCFSASIDALAQGITLDDWLAQEKARQIQKTKQNAIGELHMDIMASISGVIKIPTGGLIDIVCDDKKIIAEIKNKHNTTKGNHKFAVYTDLAEALTRPEYKDYTGYYVEILPKGRKAYNDKFTPSDNRVKDKNKKKALARDDIRVIDGKSFYELLTENSNAVRELYEALPSIIAEIANEEFNSSLDATKVTNSSLFNDFFIKAYGELEHPADEQLKSS